MTNLKKYILVLLSCFQLVGFSQDWEHWYGKEGNTVENSDVFEHYDKGYILSGIIWSEDVYHSSSWLIKTDINGDTLWSKVLMANPGLLLRGSSPTSDGGILLAGSIIKSEPDESFAFAAKLNACGEEEWCILISLNEELCRGTDIIETPDGNIGFLVYTSNQRDVYLYKINSNGVILWKTNVCSRDNHPDCRVPIAYSISSDINGNFLVSGGVYWKNPWDDLYPIRPFFSLVLTNGQEQWVLPFGIEENIHGNGNNMIIDKDILIGFGTKWTDSGRRHGLIVSIDYFGNIIDYHVINPTEIQPNYISSILYNAVLINNNYYFKSSSGIEETGYPASIFFTSKDIFGDDFEIFDEIQYPNCHWPIPMIQKTFNNKILNGLADNEGDSRIYLTKLNQNLEQDSIYTAAYTYDSLCNQPIESGFIYFNDCNIITAIDTPTPEEYQAAKQKILLSIYPNPTNEQLTIKMENTGYHHSLQLQIVDIMGVPIFNATINNSQQEFKLNVKQWQKSLYLVQIIREGKLVGSGRFVKM